MATLVSPGVDVEIIDESNYASAGPGTVPLVLIATAANKAAPGGGIAPYTVPSQAGALFLATSQRELIQNYGTPTFKIVEGTPVHGYELNEFGLQTAYQYLGISNRCYVLRADIDLAQLEPSQSAPVGAPVAGTYWLDLSQTWFGLFQSNGNPSAGLAWTSQTVLLATDANVTTQGNQDVPQSGFGHDGNFCVVVTMSDNLIWEKIAGTWYQINTPQWKAARPTTITTRANPSNIDPASTIVFTVGGVSTTVAFDQIPDGQGGFISGDGSLAQVSTAINAAGITDTTAAVNGGVMTITNAAGDDIIIANGNGTPLTTLGITPGTHAGVQVFMTNTAQYPANSAAGSLWIKGSTPNRGAKWVVKYWDATAGWVVVNAPFYPFNSTLQDGSLSKDQAATTAFGTPVTGAIYVGYDSTNGTQQLRRWSGTMWSNLMYEAGTVPPTTDPADGTMWFNTNYRADIMYGDGSQWVGYARKFPDTDPAGVLIAGSAPKTQSDGTALVDNDLWIDASDLEHYPALYRFTASTGRWSQVDLTDQTSPFGIVFADARQNSGVNYTGNVNAGNYNYNSEATADMLASNFVDPDAPDPRTYPDGMLLFNTRYSTNNVKVWNSVYFEAGGFDPNDDFTQNTYTVGGSGAVFPSTTPGRWVTASGNSVDGTPYMGRKAQRVMVVRSLEAMLSDNEDIRSELVYFNLIAAPGYPELMDEMVVLNTDQKQVAFVVGDTPARLTSSGTDIQNWANNAKNVAATGEDGLLVANDYVGVYYPWGLSTDLSGNEIMMPPSSIALVTIAYNDQVSYPWFAPAGYTRGLVTNATSVGYLNSAGEFQPVILNQGQRDVLYTNKINPIAYMPGRGLVVYGQKTLEPTGTSALDRINVARLVNYLNYNLDNIVKPFLFEQNDAQTRSSAAAVVNSFLNGLVGLRALNDYAVLCDTTNNTPQRIDNNELWIDIAIQPLKAVEFIHIPVRILSTGADLSTALNQPVQGAS